MVYELNNSGSNLQQSVFFKYLLQQASFQIYYY